MISSSIITKALQYLAQGRVVAMARWGSFLKRLARGCRKKVERSVHLKYILMSGLDLFRSQNPHLFELVPLASTLASTIIDNNPNKGKKR
jgi:hypothetical protein